VIIELTVPWESNIQIQNYTKTEKYKCLVKDGEGNGFKVYFKAVEVGACGTPAVSMFDMLNDLGLTAESRNAFLDEMFEKAVKASHKIWSKRNTEWHL
jgi:hypothetical protein